MRGVNIVQLVLLPRICSQQAAPGREIPDKILAKLGAEICGCKKQGNVNTTHESYGLEVKQEGGKGAWGKRGRD